MSNHLAIPVNDIQSMANAVAKSGLFGMKKPEEAMALMLIAHAEGQHPALAARDYNIIQGKPALKADAMMARFQAAGGKVEWKEISDNRVCAVFSHPQGGSAEIDWDMDRAKAAQLGGKDMWKKFPRQMLRSRVISEGIRTVYPGVVIGVYTPEEVQDFDERPQQSSSYNSRSAAPKQSDGDTEIRSLADNLRAGMNACATPEDLEAFWEKSEDQLSKINAFSPTAYKFLVDIRANLTEKLKNPPVDAEFTETEKESVEA